VASLGSALLLASELARLSGFSPRSWLARRVERERIFLDVGNERVRLDLYRAPEAKPRAAVVASLGMFFRGLDDQRFRQVCRALARAGLWVLAPQHADLAGFRFSAEPVLRIVAAFERAAALPGMEEGRRVGLLGFCVGGAASLCAAADPRIRDRVRFVATFGAAFDLREFGRYTLTGKSEHGQAIVRGTPQKVWGVVILANLAPQIGLGADEAGLRRYLAEVLAGDEPAIARAWDALSPEAQEVLGIVGSGDPAAGQALFDRLSRMMPGDWISPRDVAHLIRCPVFVFHGRQDPFVPYTEALKIHDALAERVPTRLLISGLAGHTEVDPLPSPWTWLKDAARFLAWVRALLATALG
jgi:dienelactone hydrolase